MPSWFESFDTGEPDPNGSTPSVEAPAPATAPAFTGRHAQHADAIQQAYRQYLGRDASAQEIQDRLNDPRFSITRHIQTIQQSPEAQTYRTQQTTAPTTPAPTTAPTNTAPRSSTTTTLMEGEKGKLGNAAHMAKSPKYQFLSLASQYGRGQEGELLKRLQTEFGDHWKGWSFDGRGNFTHDGQTPLHGDWKGVQKVDAYGGYNSGGALKARWGVEGGSGQTTMGQVGTPSEQGAPDTGWNGTGGTEAEWRARYPAPEQATSQGGGGQSRGANSERGSYYMPPEDTSGYEDGLPPANGRGLDLAGSPGMMVNEAPSGGRGLDLAGLPGMVVDEAPAATPPSTQPFEYERYNAPAPFVAPTDADMAQDPGYRFRVQQGQQALETSAAGKRMLRHPNTMRGLVDYGQQAASQEYQNVYARRSGEYDRQTGLGMAAHQANNQGRLGAFGANTGAEISRGNLRLGERQASQSYDLGRRNVDLGNRQADQSYALGRGNLALGNRQAGNSYALGRGNLALGYRAADQSYDLGRRNVDLGYRQAANSYALGQGNIGLGYHQANQSYNLGMGNLALGNRQADQGNALNWANYGLNSQEADFSRGYRMSDLGLRAADRQANYGSQYGQNQTGAIGAVGNANSAARGARGQAWGTAVGNIGGMAQDWTLGRGGSRGRTQGRNQGSGE